MQFDFQQSLNRYQRTLLRIYFVGLGLMIAFNWTCYAGTFIGVFGWASIWPIYIPATLVRMMIFGDTMGICPGPIGGIR